MPRRHEMDEIFNETLKPLVEKFYPNIYSYNNQTIDAEELKAAIILTKNKLRNKFYRYALFRQSLDSIIGKYLVEEILWYAAKYRHKQNIELLLKYGGVRKHIAAEYNRALCIAAENGHIGIVKLLLKYEAVKAANAKKISLINPEDYALSRAAKNGHKDIVELLLSYAAVRANVAEAGNYSLCVAAEFGHVDIVKLLLTYESVRVNIVSFHNTPCYKAAKSGHAEIVQILLTYAAVVANISCGNNYIFRDAARNGHKEIVELLLKYPSVFSYAEIHVQEYSNHVNPFVDEFLTKLVERREAYNAQHANGVFDIHDPAEANLCYYIIRNLIRMQNAVSLDRMSHLLEIPNVEILAHTNDNELLRLAIRLGNQDTILKLLEIPAVHELAMHNDYYQNEATEGMNLAQISQDRESSIVALTQLERSNLARIVAKYNPSIVAIGGVDTVINAFKMYLKEKYVAAPANYNGIDLPFEFQELVSLWQQKGRFDVPTDVLEEYYKNPYHTAYRYLSRPNYWMNPNAAFVQVSPDNTQLRFANFEQYKPLIALLWLAASDHESAPNNGGSVADRIENFIKSIALIGRAHNWDRTRKVKVFDPKTSQYKEITQEYDDLTGDRPSCYSGVNRRLFESLIGHELLEPVTNETLKLELRGLVYNYYIELLKNLTTEQKQLIYDALYLEPDGYLHSWDFEKAKPLQDFNIDGEVKNKFKAMLVSKYKDKPFMNCALFCNTMFDNKLFGNSDILKFFQSCGIDFLFEKLKEDIEQASNNFKHSTLRL